jgi:hypothetical protein
MYHTIPIYTFNSVFYTFPAVTTLHIHRFSLKCNVLAREVWYPIAEMTQSVDFPVFSVQGNEYGLSLLSYCPDPNASLIFSLISVQ